MDILAKQQATYEVLIKRFGPEVGLSLDLYQKVANGKATTAENIDYQKKADALTERVQKFYRETDVAQVDKMPARDVDVLIAMLNTGFTVTQNQTKHITKVMNNSTMERRLTEATSNQPVSVTGFVGADEATKALSPQQQATTLGLDYEARDKQTGEIKRDFLLQTGTDAQGKPRYEPIPQTCYMKIPYTEELKKSTVMTLDVRLYEKIVERAKTTGDPIATMAKEIVERDVCLKYKANPTESAQEVANNCTEFTKKYKEVKSDNPPFTGLGFSSYGERISSGFMNMHPEMNITVKLDKDNYHKYVGTGEVEFYAKFAKNDKNLDTYTPQGSTDVLLGKWDGKKVTIPDNAQLEYTENCKLVRGKFDEVNQKKLENQQLKFSLDRVKIGAAGENEKKNKLPEALEEQIKKDGHLILSKNKKISNKSRDTLAEEHEKKRKKEEEEEKMTDNREKVSLSDEQNKRKKKRKNQETEEQSSEDSES